MSARWITSIGLGFVAAALAVFMAAGEQAGFTASLVMLAAGWSLATSGATLWLHDEAAPDRVMLGLHDGALFLAAIIGALAAYPFAG